MGNTRVIVVRCVKCKKKLFRYEKVGKGQLIRAYRARILRDYTSSDGSQVTCQCGHVVGKDFGSFIEMSDYYRVG